MSALAAGFSGCELDPTKHEVRDGTRAFTLDGSVTLRLPSAMTSSPVGAISKPQYYIRCRFVVGSYDAAPALQDVALNGLRVEQSVPSGMTFVIDSAATIHYSASGPPQPNQVAFIRMTLGEKNKIVALDFNGNAESDPGFLIYDYREPKHDDSGLLAFEGALLGSAANFPANNSKSPALLSMLPVSCCSRSNPAGGSVGDCVRISTHRLAKIRTQFSTRRWER